MWLQTQPVEVAAGLQIKGLRRTALLMITAKGGSAERRAILLSLKKLGTTLYQECTNFKPQSVSSESPPARTRGSARKGNIGRFKQCLDATRNPTTSLVVEADANR
ncbi:MAG: hypothetical protein JNN15_01750 [Blastocatellia bacterium]|nr:hypothetical protein [Blastocatellia bacterium]